MQAVLKRNITAGEANQDDGFRELKAALPATSVEAASRVFFASLRKTNMAQMPQAESTVPQETI
jgi:hypothetical protein